MTLFSLFCSYSCQTKKTSSEYVFESNRIVPPRWTKNKPGLLLDEKNQIDLIIRNEHLIDLELGILQNEMQLAFAMKRLIMRVVFDQFDKVMESKDKLNYQAEIIKILSDAYDANIPDHLKIIDTYYTKYKPAIRVQNHYFRVLTIGMIEKTKVKKFLKVLRLKFSKKRQPKLKRLSRFVPDRIF